MTINRYYDELAEILSHLKVKDTHALFRRCLRQQNVSDRAHPLLSAQDNNTYIMSVHKSISSRSVACVENPFILFATELNETVTSLVNLLKDKLDKHTIKFGYPFVSILYRLQYDDYDIYAAIPYISINTTLYTKSSVRPLII